MIFNFGTDPVHAGLIASFNRPGGNATGISTSVNSIMWRAAAPDMGK